MSQGYYPTLLRRICTEIWRFGIAQVIVIVLAIAALALQIRYGLVREGDWRPSVLAILWPYVGLMVAFIAYQLLRVPKLLYTELQMASRSTEESLRAMVTERDKTIRERTPAEQHHYDMAKKTLKQLGPSCVIALRHLKTHGRLTFGTYGPEIPIGIGRDDLLRIYNACVAAGLVTSRDNPSQGERMFEIALTMNAVLDDLLYGNDSPTSELPGE